MIARSAHGPRASRRARRGERGQALPAVLGIAILLIAVALVLTAIGGAVTAKGRLQRAADLAALSAARSMRDDFPRLFASARLPNGAPNPRHLPKRDYLARAEAAAELAATRNDVPARAVRVRFPDSDSIAPLHARVRVRGAVELPSGGGSGRGDRDPAPGRGRDAESAPTEAVAEAEAAPPSGDRAAPGQAEGDYSGPLAYRQGEGMRPDVSRAFDRLEAAARRDGVALSVTSGYRSDAEQAELFARNPDPRMVAPPGTSLHRCGTELDLGPPSAYGWLAANAPRFGFVKRYSWEPWHFGFARGPAPCSAASQEAAAEGDGNASGGGGLPGYVPARFQDPIARSAGRWGVSTNLLAAQLLAESNFNPFAVSPAGAQGIAQFMPGTAAAYGLEDPFDAPAAIDAQGHLMSDLLRRFGTVPLALAAYNAGPGAVEECGCIPPFQETQAYVARILGLLDGAGASPAPTFEVRLVD